MTSTSTGTSRIVALVDMDCFYVQVEERDDPAIKGKPAAVVQYKDYKGGGIIAVNYEARAFGVNRNMRGDDARRLCPEIALVRVPEQRGKADLTKYRDAGRDVIKALCEFGACVERASVDEAYVDLTSLVEQRIQEFNSERDLFDSDDDQSAAVLRTLNPEFLVNNFVTCFGTTEDWLDSIRGSEMPSIDDIRLAIGTEIAGKMRETVFRKTGFRCSAGIAHNKVIAKLCCGMNKPNKQTALPHASVKELWSKTKLKKVRNLGGKLGDFLVDVLKCDMMVDLEKFSEKELSNHLGPKTGAWIYNLVRGYDDEPVNSRQLPKSIGCNKNFYGRDALKTKDEVKFWVNLLATEVHERIQRDYDANNRRAKTLTLHAIFEKSATLNRSCKLHPQYNLERMSADAYNLIDRIFTHLGFIPVNSLGLVATNFEDESNITAYAKIDTFFASISKSTASTSTTTTDASESNTTETASTSKQGQTTLDTCTPPNRFSSDMLMISKKPVYKNTSTDEPWKPFFVFSDSEQEARAQGFIVDKPKTPPKSPQGALKLFEFTECERCAQSMPLKEYLCHMDNHAARDLSREINGLPPLGFDLRPATLERNEREKEKLEKEQREREKAKRPRGGSNNRGRGPSKRGKPSPAKPENIRTIDKYFSKQS